MSHLNGGTVVLESDDFSDKALLSHTDEFIHSCSSHVVSNDNRAGNFPDVPVEEYRIQLIIKH